MRLKMWAAMAAMSMAVAGCGGSESTGEVTRGELEAAQADARAAEAEAERLAAQVADLQGQLDELTEGSGGETTDVATTQAVTTTEAPTTTTPPTGDPAALDASPYVTPFGDISAIVIPAGDPGVLAVVATAAAADRSGSLAVMVRNNTADTIGQIEVAGLARDAAGNLAGSGSSQGFDPVVVEPGEIAWGYVYFGDLTGDGLTFELTTNGEEPNTYFLPVEVTEFNVTGDQIVGVITNNLTVGVSGPCLLYTSPSPRD